MTHYWWMHWFWITTLFAATICDSSITTLHSSFTELPSSTQGTLNATARAAKSIEHSLNIPPILDASSVRNVTNFNNNTSQNVTTKYRKPSWTLAVPVTTKKPIRNEMTVINRNLTETSSNSNATADNQTFPRTLAASNASSVENVTYFGDEVNSNQTFAPNSERIGLDANEEDASGGNNLSAAGITGITLGCVVIVGVICGISYFIYHNRGFKRPQVLNDRCSNPDSSGYIDDASVRDNSEEMYSLDNDSFLNSLEAMTIQNYWTDTVKHTKL